MLRCTDIFSNITSLVKFQERSYYICPASTNATHTFNVIFGRYLNVGVNSSNVFGLGGWGFSFVLYFFQIIERFELEGTFKDHLVQTPCCDTFHWISFLEAQSNLASKQQRVQKCWCQIHKIDVYLSRGIAIVKNQQPGIPLEMTFFVVPIRSDGTNSLGYLPSSTDLPPGCLLEAVLVLHNALLFYRTVNCPQLGGVEVTICWEPSSRLVVNTCISSVLEKLQICL